MAEDRRLRRIPPPRSPPLLRNSPREARPGIRSSGWLLGDQRGGAEGRYRRRTLRGTRHRMLRRCLASRYGGDEGPGAQRFGDVPPHICRRVSVEAYCRVGCRTRWVWRGRRDGGYGAFVVVGGVLHRAAQALRLGECSVGGAGGVTVHESPEWLCGFPGRTLASDGRCRSIGVWRTGWGWRGWPGWWCGAVCRMRAARHEVLALVPGECGESEGRSNGLRRRTGRRQQRVSSGGARGAGWAPADVDVVGGMARDSVWGIRSRSRRCWRPTVGPRADVVVGVGDVEHRAYAGASGVAGVIKMVAACVRVWCRRSALG